MNRLRHLQAKHVVGRWMSYLILCVLALRLLLPTGLMLDTSTEGDSSSFGLVICSGHGPLVIAAPGAADDADFSAQSKVVNALEHAGALNKHFSIAPDQSGSTQTDNTSSSDICPFSSALINVLLAVAVILVFCHFSALIVPRYQRQNVIFIQRLFRSSHSARAPPLFA